MADPLFPPQTQPLLAQLLLNAPWAQANPSPGLGLPAPAGAGPMPQSALQATPGMPGMPPLMGSGSLLPHLAGARAWWDGLARDDNPYGYRPNGPAGMSTRSRTLLAR